MTRIGRNFPYVGGGIRFGHGLTVQAWFTDRRPRVAVHRTSLGGLMWFARIAG